MKVARSIRIQGKIVTWNFCIKYESIFVLLFVIVEKKLCEFSWLIDVKFEMNMIHS